MEFSTVVGNLLLAVFPIAEDMEAIVIVGAALDAAEMIEYGWVGGSEINTVGSHGNFRCFCSIFCLQGLIKMWADGIYQDVVVHTKEDSLLRFVVNI